MFNLETDYAIRIVQCLAESDTRLDAKTIAERTGVTPRFTLKILHGLVGGNIVKSFKGKLGGYVLARPKEEITLLTVVEEVFGPLEVSKCNVDGTCTHPNGICKFHSVFDDIEKTVKEKLAKVTFE